jgi:hypothetical protein
MHTRHSNTDSGLLSVDSRFDTGIFDFGGGRVVCGMQSWRWFRCMYIYAEIPSYLIRHILSYVLMDPSVPQYSQAVSPVRYGLRPGRSTPRPASKLMIWLPGRSMLRVAFSEATGPGRTTDL